MTVKSSAVSLYSHLPSPEALESIPQKFQGQEFLINLIDSPGHVDFSSEVTASLRVTDGVLILIDCIDSACMQTETLLRHALAERVRPAIVINKVDRALLEYRMSKEDLYQSFSKTIESVNTVTSTCSDKALEDVQFQPSQVVFGSGLHEWGFTIRQFAMKYAQKFGIDREKLVERLWVGNQNDT